ncbi:MAG: hypothetical protein IKZ00_08175 [Bacteroidaceae bacterium]|nr:hypothetical protein [Bacteroidaceae bacterium]
MTIIERAKALRELIREYAVKSEDKTLVIATKDYFEPWTPGEYAVGDIRLDGNGNPKECIMAHDSTANPSWDISTATLWKPYHSWKKEYALPWEAPTGAHDMYLAGEYMIYKGETYICKLNTNYSPDEYGQAWEKA